MKSGQAVFFILMSVFLKQWKLQVMWNDFFSGN